MAKTYKYFVGDMENLDFSNKAKIDMFGYESGGKPDVHFNAKYNGRYNGYAVGKHWMDVTLAMWREDVAKGLLTKHELYNDDDVPEVIKEMVSKFYRWRLMKNFLTWRRQDVIV